MKKMISSYIIAGTTETSRLLRFMTVFLTTVLVFSLVVFFVYKTAIPIALYIFKMLDIGWPLLFSILGLFKNYLLIALSFLIALVIVGYLAYEREDRKKIWDRHYNIVFFGILILFSVVSFAFSVYYAVQGSLGDSFYHFLTLVISFIAFVSLVVSLPMVTTLHTFNDFINYLTKVYLKSPYSYVLTTVFFLSSGILVAEPRAIIFSIVFMAIIGTHSLFMSKNLISDIRSGNRVRLLELRGYKFNLEHEGDELIPVCLNDFGRGYRISKRDEECNENIFLALDTFKENISRLYKENGLSEETLIYMHMTYFTTHHIKGQKTVSVNMEVNYYDLDNLFLKNEKIFIP